MADHDRVDEPAPLAFEMPDLTPRDRSCEGGCDTVKCSPGPFWCAACRDRADAADADREERTHLVDALASIPTEWADATFELADLPRRIRAPVPLRDKIIRIAKEIDLRATPMVALASLDGASGIGKTTIACAIFRRYLATREIGLDIRKAARFVSAPDVPRMTPAIFEETARRPALLLDDVGGEGTNPTARDAVSQILRSRQAWHLPTIVTTWCARDSISTIYGDGIARRLFERGEHLGW